MNNQDAVPFPDELEHLHYTLTSIDSALEEARKDVLRLDQEYKDAKKYMVEYSNEMDRHEKLQNERMLDQTDRTGVFAVEMCEKLEKLKESPYFARIDFFPDGEEDADTFYIGRFGFTHDNEKMIFDWRAPVSGMFYDFSLGRAGFEAPVGWIEGELTRKRQFKIQKGSMEYALESGTNVHDEILQKEIAHTSDEKMKSIISTIQREQNVIIRNECVYCDNFDQQLKSISALIQQFEAGENAALGIVVKTDAEAKRYCELLSGEYPIHLLSQESTRFTKGVSITSIRMAKGLEFDEVIVADADNRNYASEYDRNLLYIACTRAMHKLTIFYTGNPSPYLPQ